MLIKTTHRIRIILIAILITPLIAIAHPTEPAIAQEPPQRNNDCTVNVKINDFTVLADMGDGFLDGQMEVQVIFSVGHDRFIIDRYYPSEGEEKMRTGDSRRLEDFIFSVPAAEEVRIEILAVEIDNLPRLFGVDVGMVFVGLGSFFESLGGAGNLVGGLVRSGVDALRNNFADESIITDDVLTLYADDWWNAGGVNTYRTADDDFEISYRVAVSNCTPVEGA